MRGSVGGLLVVVKCCTCVNSCIPVRFDVFALDLLCKIVYAVVNA